MADDSPPSSFDPALYLHSDLPDSEQLPEPEPESFSDDIEALHLQRLDTARENHRKGIVIQSRTWNISEVFRSDDDIRPGMQVVPFINYPSNTAIYSYSNEVS
jgi:chromosome transmission fidelity protein 18